MKYNAKKNSLINQLIGHWVLEATLTSSCLALIEKTRSNSLNKMAHARIFITHGLLNIGKINHKLYIQPINFSLITL